ncbi:MAG TPA: hypothetical protein VEX70_07825 [Pyrinomonadaceae bacterium]|jgi:hypothetical protein|nr:hypothetical protein [Pyrinomonadaceae bacterium]
MKKSLHRIAISLVLCILLGSVALAGGKSRHVTFSKDIKVGDTLVKKGTYVVTFDEKTNELTFRDNNKKIVAKTTGRMEERKPTYPVTFVTDRDKENNLMLAGVQLGGRLVLLGGETATAPATAAAPATGQQ